MLDARHHNGVGLLLFDLDDTIVQAGSVVSKRVLDALRRAHDAGFLLSISSGRALCMVNRSILSSGVMDFAVCSNGARVVSLREEGCLFSHNLSKHDALDCYELLREFRPAWNAFFGGRAYFEWKGASYMLTGRTGAIARTSRYASADGGRVRHLLRMARRGMRYAVRMVTRGRIRQVVSVGPQLQKATGGVEKMGCSILDASACAEAAERLRADGRFEVVRMGSTELEITARGVTKGAGARALMDLLGVDPAHVVAFGDGGNDLPLVSAVGRFVAVDNADDALKNAAYEVCPSVDKDGVAVWIENMLASGGLKEGTRYV